MTNKERMSQIGEVMDELVKLGFRCKNDDYLAMQKITKNTTGLTSYEYYDVTVIFNTDDSIEVWSIFRDKDKYSRISDTRLVTYITSPTFHEDVINKVKELLDVRD